jgi:hypothetical protein
MIFNKKNILKNNPRLVGLYLAQKDGQMHAGIPWPIKFFVKLGGQLTFF